MERKTLQEIRRKTTKNLLWSLAELEREKKVWKLLKKGELNKRNKMHAYEMKWFSKTQVLNPIFPNLRFSNILPLILKHKICFAQKLKVIANLVGQTEKHT